MQTKKQMTVAMIAMLGVNALESNPAAQEKFQKLSGAQIQANQYDALASPIPPHLAALVKRLEMQQ